MTGSIVTNLTFLMIENNLLIVVGAYEELQKRFKKMRLLATNRNMWRLVQS